MRFHVNLPVAAGLLAAMLVFHDAGAAMAQVRRYEPSRPTVSPYLNLFRRENNPYLPNYHSFVRPLQQQHQANQLQQQALQQQSRALQQLQSQVQQVEQGRATGPLVAPTGKGSWFLQQGSRSTFLNTSRFYSQSGASRTGR